MQSPPDEALPRYPPRASRRTIHCTAQHNANPKQMSHACPHPPLPSPPPMCRATCICTNARAPPPSLFSNFRVRIYVERAYVRALQCGARVRAPANGLHRPPALPRTVPIPSRTAPRRTLGPFCPLPFAQTLLPPPFCSLCVRRPVGTTACISRPHNAQKIHPHSEPCHPPPPSPPPNHPPTP